MREFAGIRVMMTSLTAVVCLLAPLSVLAEAPASAGAAPEGEETIEPLGYRIEGEKVVFTFDRSLYKTTTHGDTGVRAPMADFKLDENTSITLAGEFNSWSTYDWPLELVESGVYELRLPLNALDQRGTWAFKFVLDGMVWIEPPASAPNAVPTGLGNGSFNLLLVLETPDVGKTPEGGKTPAAGGEAPRAPETGERVPQTGERAPQDEKPAVPKLASIDSPALKRLMLTPEQLGGACALKPADRAIGAPIPVDSNPLLTSDSRVISFVSVFVMPPTPEEEASWEKEMSTKEPGAGLSRVQELMAERTAGVRAVYVAIYESSEGGPETGVFALEFSRRLTDERREELTLEGPGGAVLTSRYVAAAVWTDDPDSGCLDVVRAHVAEVLGR